jgi:hypothetical protein
LTLCILIIVIHVVSNWNTGTDWSKKNFDWNNPIDVENFLKWKEKHGSGWSNN